MWVELLLPEFNDLLRTSLTLRVEDLIGFAPYVVLLIVIVSVIAGAYPALHLSGFRPVETLKGSWTAGKRVASLRKGLVIFQFSVSALLVIATAVAYSQIRYMSNQQVGFEKDLIVSLRVFNLNGALRPIADTVKNDFLRHPGVLKASVVFGRLTSPVLVTARPDGHPEGVQIYAIGADEDLVDVYGLALASGRNIRGTGEYLINQTAAKTLGWDDPIGKELSWQTEDAVDGHVVGVLEDFNFQSYREPIRALMVTACPFPQHLELRLSPHNLHETMTFLRETFERRVGMPYSGYFLDARIEDMYVNERRVGQALMISGSLAILVACLGLFGLAAFAAEQRTKEVGIRKVLGATVADITMLISKEFVLLVAVANAIAWPLAWHLLNGWLDGFAYRIDLGPSFFALSAAVGLGVVLITVSYQAIKASTSDPVNALRQE